MVIMNQTIKSLHRYCSIGPQLGLALLALMYDTRAWYDTVAAFAILFSISSIIICNNLELSYRGFLHTICVVVGVIGQEMSRQPRSIDWNLLSTPEYMGITMAISNSIKGIGTFVKLLPSIEVIGRVTDCKTRWNDYVGWILSLISSFYFLQEPNIYRNDKAMAEWRQTFAWIETIHWSGLALSASSHCNGAEWAIIIITPLEPLFTFLLFYASITLATVL